MPVIDLGLLISGTNNATAGLRSAGADLDDLGTHVKKVGENSQATAERLKAIEVVIGGILIEKAVELTKAFVEMASEVQNTDIRVAAWSQGLSGSQGLLDKFNDSVGASGVKLADMGNAFVKLRTAGVGADQAYTTVKNLVDGIAAVGGGDLSSKLDAAATAFQRFSSKGVVSTRELNAVINSTGLTLKDLAKAGGVSIDTFNQELKDKTISAATFLDDFNKAATEKFGGFSKLLEDTVSGSLSKFHNDFELAFASLGESTGLSAQVTAFIQNLDTAIVNLIKNIKPQDIAAFFNVFKDAAPVIADVVELLINVGKVLLLVVDAAFKFAGLLPNDAVEFGIIGYVLMGKKGALLLGLIGALTGQLSHLGDQVQSIAKMYNALPETEDKGGFLGPSKYQTLLDRLNAQNPNSPVTNMFTAMGEAAFAAAGNVDNALLPSLKTLATDAKGWFGSFGSGDKNNFVTNLFGTPEQIAAIQKAMEALSQHKFGTTGLTDAPTNNAAANKLATLRTELQNTLAGVGGKDQALAFGNAGDVIDQKLQQITDTSQGWVNQLESARTKITNSKLPLSEQKIYLDAISMLEGKIVTDTQAALDLQVKLNQLKNAQLDIETQISINSNNEAVRQLNLLSARQNAGAGIAAGTPGGALMDQVDSQQVAYTQQILGYHQQILALQSKELSDTANAGVYKAQEDSLQTLIDKTAQFASSLTYDAQLQSNFYKELGSTLNNDIASGLSGLIQGTETWGDVGRKVFGDLIDMSIKYLLQLAEMKLLTMALGAFSSGGVIPGGIQPFANGGVPNASNVTPFANGGLTTGPTLFGLMGEAGTEAIMPLTRVGGKLGVNVAGAGGGSGDVHIHVNAIDTQSGLQFVAKHIGTIKAGLNQNQKLNTKN